MSLEQLSSYLEKYKKITPPDENIRLSVSKTIEKELGFSVPLKNIRVSGKTVFVVSDPAYKNEIFIKKEKLIRKINEGIEGKKIGELR